MSRPSQRSVAVAGKSTPFAYATPHSGPFVGGPGFNAYNNGGDTEPDDDDDDGEQSWRGVTDGDNGEDSEASWPDSNALREDSDDELYAQRQGDDEDDEDVFDSLLSIIED
jgi:hypothetical protein